MSAPPPDIRKLIQGNAPLGKDSKDDVIADLQSKIEDATQKRNEERFIWILVIVVIIDIGFLTQANNWSAPLVIGVLELVGLVVVAEKCKVNPIIQLIDRISPILPIRRQ
jgi:hypothetical protein